MLAVSFYTIKTDLLRCQMMLCGCAERSHAEGV